MADMCYKCQFSDNGYFCRFMEHGVCTAVSCKWMVEFEGRETYKLLNGNAIKFFKEGNQNGFHEKGNGVNLRRS